MDDTEARRAPQGREQAWSDAAPEQGRVVVVTDNPIARALVRIMEVVGRETTLLADEDVDEMPLQWLAANPLGERDAFVMCDHDTPDMDQLLRAALAGDAGYVAMMASRRRAGAVSADLEQSLPAEALRRLHMPAGLDVGGKAPGEIALSVAAEIVAHSYGRSGGPMRRR
jgi:xanthine/CO dehydrogenase XdhC/CoxF family maturation factor